MSEVACYMVTADAGDGSNFTEWVLDQNVIDKMEQLANEGDEVYASGDGLQVITLIFKDQDMLDYFIARNRIMVTTMEEFEDREDY